MGYHVGRSWEGNSIEAACPCPKEPCGLIDLSKAVQSCSQHTVIKTMRQGHRVEDCSESLAIKES